MKPKTTSGAFLARKSELAIKRSGRPPPSDILIIEDETRDAGRVEATLRAMFGYEMSIRQVATINMALDALLQRLPDLIFLDDHLKPADRAGDTIPLIRRCNYTGPIILMSGLLSPRRQAEVVRLGAVAAIHKDALDSGSIEEALAKAWSSDASS
ncbi:MAG: response regulator [Hyphomicrobiales bacterium]|nr:response regulator [Hyphomicrobiales bacterium]